MPIVKFTHALQRFFPSLSETRVAAGDLPQLLMELEAKYPGLRNYIVDDQGVLRQHVNIFIDGDLIEDREKLSDRLAENSEIYIMQALSGG